MQTRSCDFATWCWNSIETGLSLQKLIDQRRDLTNIVQLPQGASEVQSARQALRYDDAAQPGRLCGTQAPVRVFDNDAFVGAEAVLPHSREVGLGVGLGMPVVFAHEREIDPVQQTRVSVDDLKVLPPRTGAMPMRTVPWSWRST